MAIKKLPDGRFHLSIRPHGRKGKHIRRTFVTRSAAVRFEKELLAGLSSNDHLKLSTVFNLWFEYFGSNLKDGFRRLAKLNMFLDFVGDMPLSSLKAIHYLEYRATRLNAGISANTCNHDLAYLKTAFNKLKRIDIITLNPFANIQLLKIEERQLSYLTSYEIKRLLVSCRKSTNESLFPVVYFCLSTGCRWSEAEKLTASQLHNYSVTFIKTKSGRNRTVPLKPELYDYLKSRFVLSDGRIFANCLSAFRSAVTRSRLHFPVGQSSHILRHTFASHFMMNGGDVLTLQKILGHSDVKITMKYAHLSPDYLQDSLKYSPI